jgi:glycosyltransferase involved in cell wall biosynthesis
MKNKRIVMTLLVRDEEDIVKHNVEFHLGKGVDFIIATDNGSVDKTRSILLEYEDKGVLHLIDEPELNHDQVAWVNRMGKIALEKYEADIIFHCDADEFWYPRSGDLRTEILGRPEDVLYVDVVHVALEEKNGAEEFPQNTRFAVVHPIEPKDYEAETANYNFYLFRNPPKVIFKTDKRLFEVSMGNHLITNKDKSIMEGVSQDIVIYHYPVRNKKQFLSKVIKAGSSYEKNTTADMKNGFHLRRWYGIYKQGFFDDAYCKVVLNEIEIEDLLNEGRVEEVDFDSMLSGRPEKGFDWRFFNRRFEYTDLLDWFDTGWHGHVIFAYDLVRNTCPKRIVELGTHKGHSFFSFCQAVKDGWLNTELYAVDTWRGDNHTGPYDESIWNNINKVRKTFYDGLNLTLVRKTFDEARDDFEDESIDLLHIDGYHTYEAVKHDFESWIGKVRNDGFVLFHDIAEKHDDFGVFRLWGELKGSYDVFEFHHSHGLGILCKKPGRISRLFNSPNIWERYYATKMNAEHMTLRLERDIRDKEQEISELGRVALQREQEIEELKLVVNQKDSEIEWMKSSKFWKIRSLYMSVKQKTKGPFRLLKKCLYFSGLVGHAILRGGLKNTLKNIIRLYHQAGLAGIKQRFRMAATPDFDRNDYTEWIRRYDTLTDEGRIRLRTFAEKLPVKPPFSVVMPVYNANPEWLVQSIESVRKQTYPHWELCVADDASTNKHIRPILERYAKKDPRIKVVFREQNGHICAASNSALELATGDWVVLLDHDDLIAEHALSWAADAINRHSRVRLIYSDEDKVDENGKRFDPYFKCDWNEDLLYSQNMISHLGIYQTALLRNLGGFRSGFEGSQDYDLALRYVEHIEPDQIYHIPRILYHWRAHAESTAQTATAKPYAAQAGKKALDEYLLRQKVNATATLLPFGMYRIQYVLPDVKPLVSLIIPSKNQLELLQKCVESILIKTVYPNYEIVIVDNGSDDPKTIEYFRRIKLDPRVRILCDDRLFNYSALNNAAAREARGELLGLINNDLEVISPEWLSEMVSHALRPEVGAVGACLWYPNNTLQHGGVVLGVGGVAGHAHKHLARYQYGYFGRASLIQSFSAVSAACLVIRKSVYDEVGGFNETDLRVAFNDVDFCLRVRKKGYRNLWTPYAELYHHESASRGHDNTPEKRKRFAQEVAYMKQEWGSLLQKDPAYSPNLTLDREDFSLAWPPRMIQSDGSSILQGRKLENICERIEESGGDMNILDVYIAKGPSPQNVLNIFSGEWSSRLPAGSNLITTPGHASLFEDLRINWVAEIFGGFAGKICLELGPLEGGHSYMLQKMGAKRIIAIEANSRAFLKCLCIKEVFNLDKVEFKYGDFRDYFTENNSQYDILIASGVLYHMRDPIQLIEQMSRFSDHLFVWTHYYDAAIINARDDLRTKFRILQGVEKDGVSYQWIEQSYDSALDWNGFCGGSAPTSRWMTRESIINCLKANGYDQIDISFEAPDHPNGPSFAVCAQRNGKIYSL